MNKSLILALAVPLLFVLLDSAVGQDDDPTEGPSLKLQNESKQGPTKGIAVPGGVGTPRSGPANTVSPATSLGAQTSVRAQAKQPGTARGQAGVIGDFGVQGQAPTAEPGPGSPMPPR